MFSANIQRSLSVLGVICLLIIDAQALPPANDACDTAIALDGAISGSTVGATGSGSTECSLNDTFDVWYALSIPSGAGFTVAVAPDDFDASIALYEGCGGTLLDCDDVGNAAAINSVSGANTSGAVQEYGVRIAGSNGSTGNFGLTLTLIELPSNDGCANATPLSPGLTEGSSVNATGGTVSACSLNDTADVWYALMLAAGSQASVAITPDGFDVSLELLDGCDGAVLDCDDSGPAAATNTVYAVNDLGEAHTYLVRVAGVNGSTGPFTIETTVAELPGNDTCDSATPLAAGTTPGTSVNATGSDTNPCSLNDYNDVWYSAWAPRGTALSVAVTPTSAFDASIALFDGCGGALLDCDDSGPAAATNTVGATNAGAGAEYLVRVAGINGTTGNYDLDVSLADAEGDTSETLQLAYARFAAVIDGPSNDLDRDRQCDSEELACFASLLETDGNGAVAAAYFANREQAANDIGPEILALVPNLDSLFGAWVMLGKAFAVDIVLSLEECTGCNKQFSSADYDLSQNSFVAAAVAACNLPSCGQEGFTHSADVDHDGRITLQELLRGVQLFVYGGYHCDAASEDRYAPGPGDTSCAPHSSDYAPTDYRISLAELLRLLQLYSAGNYHACPGEGTEDGYCLGLA